MCGSIFNCVVDIALGGTQDVKGTVLTSLQGFPPVITVKKGGQVSWGTSLTSMAQRVKRRRQIGEKKKGVEEGKAEGKRVMSDGRL